MNPILRWTDRKTPEEADTFFSSVVSARVLLHGFAYHGRCPACDARVVYSHPVAPCPVCGATVALVLAGDKDMAEEYQLETLAERLEVRA